MRREAFRQWRRQVVLGDGSAWIWNTAHELFPDAVQILDRFHATEHLSLAGKAVYADSAEGKAWIHARYEELDQGRLSAVVQALRVHIKHKEVHQCIRYLWNNRRRMRYANKLNGVLRNPGAKLIYTYDFGDNWEHAVVLEKRLPLLLDMNYPICIDGKLACPPDDCGGIPGFYNLLDALADPHHEQHEELRDWIGDEFDPQAFSVDPLNQKLAPKRSSVKLPKF